MGGSIAGNLTPSLKSNKLPEQIAITKRAVDEVQGRGEQSRKDTIKQFTEQSPNQLIKCLKSLDHSTPQSNLAVLIAEISLAEPEWLGPEAAELAEFLSAEISIAKPITNALRHTSRKGVVSFEATVELLPTLLSILETTSEERQEDIAWCLLSLSHHHPEAIEKTIGSFETALESLDYDLRTIVVIAIYAGAEGSESTATNVLTENIGLSPVETVIKGRLENNTAEIAAAVPAIVEDLATVDMHPLLVCHARVCGQTAWEVPDTWREELTESHIKQLDAVLKSNIEHPQIVRPIAHSLAYAASSFARDILIDCSESISDPDLAEYLEESAELAGEIIDITKISSIEGIQRFQIEAQSTSRSMPHSISTGSLSSRAQSSEADIRTERFQLVTMAASSLANLVRDTTDSTIDCTERAKDLLEFLDNHGDVAVDEEKYKQVRNDVEILVEELTEIAESKGTAPLQEVSDSHSRSYISYIESVTKDVERLYQYSTL